MKKYSITLGLMLFGPLLFASAFSKSMQEDAVKKLFPLSEIKAYVDKRSLPMPWDYLLVQPLMTIGIETFYQRKTMIHPIIAKMDASGKKYSRCIIMLMDSRKTRNNPEKAVQEHESLVAEIAFIRINITELPSKVVEEILYSNIPFGKILLNHKIKVNNQEQRYFSVSCDKNLSLLIGCRQGEIMYGRNNKLVSGITKQTLAEVTEILPKISQEMFKDD